MATVCDYCGHRTNEVKSSGGIEETGLKVEIIIKEKIDLSRDVLKVSKTYYTKFVQNF